MPKLDKKGQTHIKQMRLFSIETTHYHTVSLCNLQNYYIQSFLLLIYYYISALHLHSHTQVDLSIKCNCNAEYKLK